MKSTTIYLYNKDVEVNASLVCPESQILIKNALDIMNNIYERIYSRHYNISKSVVKGRNIESITQENAEDFVVRFEKTSHSRCMD
ncbi:MAG: hypothetical protein HC892_20720 [Saprospiraceae bacterium]|nr:hypothetical protein [Saprospiraceae bacterium]